MYTPCVLLQLHLDDRRTIPSILSRGGRGGQLVRGNIPEPGIARPTNVQKQKRWTFQEICATTRLGNREWGWSWTGRLAIVSSIC